MGTSPNCPKSKSHAHHQVARSVGMKESAWEDSPDPVSFYFHMEISDLRVCVSMENLDTIILFQQKWGRPLELLGFWPLPYVCSSFSCVSHISVPGYCVDLLTSHDFDYGLHTLHLEKKLNNNLITHIVFIVWITFIK